MQNGNRGRVAAVDVEEIGSRFERVTLAGDAKLVYTGEVEY